MGIAAAGASVGGTVFPVAARSLIEQVGWGEGCLVAAFEFSNVMYARTGSPGRCESSGSS